MGGKLHPRATDRYRAKGERQNEASSRIAIPQALQGKRRQLAGPSQRRSHPSMRAFPNDGSHGGWLGDMARAEGMQPEGRGDTALTSQAEESHRRFRRSPGLK